MSGTGGRDDRTDTGERADAMDGTVDESAAGTTGPTSAPGARGEDWLLLSPLTVWAGAAVMGSAIGLPVAVTAVILAVAGVPAVWVLLTVVGGLAVVGLAVGADVLRYRRTRYRVTEERFEAASGVIARSHKSLPRDRIRSVDIAIPLWARPFGLCRVEIGTGESAGAGEAMDLVLVPVAEGERLRRVLLDRGGATGGADVVDGGTAPLVRMAPRWYGYGLFAWGPAAVGYGGLAALLGSFTELIIRVALPWVLGRTEGASAVALTLWAVGALAVFVAVASAVALALHTESWWDYELTRESDGTLRVRRGLLTRTSVSIEERRLRGVELVERLPLRWMGVASAAAVASGLDQAQEGQGSKGGLVPKRALTPEMPRKGARNAAEAAVRARSGIAFDGLRAHPWAALRRRIVRALACAAVVASVVGGGLWTLAAVTPLDIGGGAVGAALFGTALLTLLVGIPYAVGCFRGLGHGLDGRFLLLRKGMAARSTVALKRESVIGWTVRRSPFQRWSGLATLGATVAAGRGVHDAPDVDCGEGLAFAEEAVPGLLAPFLERD
ncbi:PH domain-containing protein [Nocardiopsis baichengensis]|uniref:PH domain-containing protein n=1 Tax=Nocardiopsis baichengensis TaxID=280240 RepID=UPI000347C594|nr:PH domain-containing protein [Nocardiopsis baichengensis]